MIENRELAQQLAELVQTASKLTLASLSKLNDVSLAPIEQVPLVQAHWMAIIVISGKDVRLTFKAHFMTAEAAYFASKIYRRPPAEVEAKKAIDFMKEFCNLVAGRTKVSLKKNELSVGVSLPALARGFDELYYVRQDGSVLSDWRLLAEDVKIDCSLHIQLFKSFIFTASREEPFDGDMEVL